MKKILTLCILSLILAFNAHSENYSYFSLGLTEHTAEDPHDSSGTTYLKDPDDRGLVVSYGFGNRSGNLAIETEFSYYGEVTQKLTSDVNVDITTLSIMENIMYTSDAGSNGYILAGLGLGFSRTNVDTNYNSSGDTLNKSKDTTNFGHQIILGFGIEKYEIVFKHSDFGEVKGGSGTTSNGNSYAADEFDSVYNSISLKYKF